MLVKVNERGTVENFVLKCTERLCGAAQLEIMEQTVETMNKYLEAVKNDMEVSIASDVYQGTYQYEELVDMQFVYNAQNNTD
jgi:hypothetical protein